MTNETEKTIKEEYQEAHKTYEKGNDSIVPVIAMCFTTALAALFLFEGITQYNVTLAIGGMLFAVITILPAAIVFRKKEE